MDFDLVKSRYTAHSKERRLVSQNFSEFIPYSTFIAMTVVDIKIYCSDPLFIECHYKRIRFLLSVSVFRIFLEDEFADTITDTRTCARLNTAAFVSARFFVHDTERASGW